MTVLVGPVAIVAAGSVDIEQPARQPGQFAHVVLDNATPYVLTIVTGGNGRAIPPFTADVVTLDNASLFLTGVFAQVPGGPAATTQSYLAATFYTDDDELPSSLPSPLTSQLIQAALTGPVALQAGSTVGITGTPNVAVPGGVGITNTPTVGLSAGATVGISGTPTVDLSAGATVGVTGAATTKSPASGTPTFAQRLVAATSVASASVTTGTTTLIPAPGAAAQLELHGVSVSLALDVNPTNGSQQGNGTVTYTVAIQRLDNSAQLFAANVNASANGTAHQSNNGGVVFDFQGATLPLNVGVKIACSTSTNGTMYGGSSPSAQVTLDYSTLT